MCHNEITSVILLQLNRHQEEHAEKLKANMNNIMEEITQLRHKQTMMKAAIQDAKWKQANLTRRVLKVETNKDTEQTAVESYY